MLNRVFLYVFGGIGIAMLLATAILIYVKVGMLSSYVKTTGTVIENRPHVGRKSRTYTPVVTFRTTDGQTITFEGGISSNPPSFDLQEQIPVYYAPQDPQKAEIGTFFQLWFLPLIFGFMGTIFTSIGAGFGIATYLHRKKIEWLTTNGQRIKAHFQSVQIDRSQRSKYRRPFRIYCQWQDTLSNKLYVFKSDAIWFDPSPYITQQIDVLIDPQNPKKYWVDTSSLPKLA